TEDAGNATANECPAVQATAPSSRGGAQVVYGNNNWGTQILGTTPDYLTIRDIGIQSGQSFTGSDVDAATKVAMVGKTVIDNLFNGADPVGQVIRIKGGTVHGGRYAGVQGPVANRPGSGRPHHHPHKHREEEGNQIQQIQRAGRATNHGA